MRAWVSWILLTAAFGFICAADAFFGKQRQLCRQNPGFAEVLEQSVKLAVHGCQSEFRDDRWNCSLGLTRLKFLKRPYKETAFLYAITSASLVYAFAKACSRGQLSFCSCDYQFNQPWHTASWRWGGCGDNVQAAEAIVAQFVLAAKYSWEGRIKSVDGHNFAVGVKTVRNNVVEHCKCHGVSGSCTVKSCWKVLGPFENITKIIRRKYRSAVKLTDERPSSSFRGTPATTAGLQIHQKMNYEHMLGVRSSKRNDRYIRRQLVYKLDDLDVCAVPGHDVAGRMCAPFFVRESGSNRSTRKRNRSSCTALCCGRGYYARWDMIVQPVNCKTQHFVINCDKSIQRVIRYYCL